MEKLGGGGHIDMAATQIKNSNLEDVIELVEQTVKSYLEEENV
jgi:DHH family phosphoesterase